ncbi:MAG: hypothetical protein MUE44_34830, partial [Oscillatoriaceae cyanobacterium Prado104]|nr:hypothetical protein [Oscillatoriaceae cyanobacterium Prado104]
MKAGWCVKCQLRIGRKRFRQLFDGMCEDCSRKYRPSGTPQPATGAASSEQKTETEQLGRSRGAGCAKIQKPKPIVSLGRTESRRDERLKQEENSLLEAFDRIKQQGITKNWHREVANLLGWKKEKVTHVAKRLRKKGLGDRIKV